MLWFFGGVVNNVFKFKMKIYYLCFKLFFWKIVCKFFRIKSRVLKENIYGFGIFNIVIIFDIVSRKCKINNRWMFIVLVNCRYWVCFFLNFIEIYILVC